MIKISEPLRAYIKFKYPTDFAPWLDKRTHGNQHRKRGFLFDLNLIEPEAYWPVSSKLPIFISTDSGQLVIVNLRSDYYRQILEENPKIKSAQVLLEMLNE